MVTPSSVICPKFSEVYSVPISVSISPGRQSQSHCSLSIRMPNLLHHSFLSAATFNIRFLREYTPPSHSRLYP